MKGAYGSTNELSFKVPDFNRSNPEIPVGRQGIVVEGLTGLASAPIEATVEKDGEFPVVDSDTDGLGRAENEVAVIIARPLPNLEVVVVRQREDEGLATPEWLFANPTGSKQANFFDLVNSAVNKNAQPISTNRKLYEFFQTNSYRYYDTKQSTIVIKQSRFVLQITKSIFSPI